MSLRDDPREIGIIFNPTSGRGRSENLSRNLRGKLEQCGQKVQVLTSERVYDARRIEQFLAPLKTLYVIGGDGTLMDLLPHISRVGIPVYMVPAGNESLFARNFHATRSLPRAVEALDHPPTEHYYGVVGEKPFFTMVSLGLDSVIVERISKKRNGPIGHRGYVLPALLSVARYRQPEITLRVDGRVVLDGKQGYLIIANSPEYALGLNPAKEASSLSPRLHARFYPGDDRSRIIPWSLKAITRSAVKQNGSLNFEGRDFQIQTRGKEPFPIQADGECVGTTPTKVQISRGTIKVLG